MSYMTISSQENHHFSLCSYFHTHPTTLLLKILGGQCMGRPPTSNFGGTVPLFPPRSPPLVSKLLGYNRCFGDRFFTPSRFCASIFCDRCFDDRCFLIAVINVHLNSEPRKNAPHIVTDTKVF